MRRLPLLILLLLALTSCEIRSHLNIDAADPSNGAITAQIGFDEDFRDAMEEFGGGADLLAEIETSAPEEGWEIEEFTDGDVEGLTLTNTFSSIEELQQLLSDSMIASGEDGGGYEDIEFIETDDTLRFEASLTTPGMEGMDEDGMEEMGAFLDFDFQIAVTFPGEVIEHNGELEERTVTWDLNEEALGGAELFAESRLGGGFPWTIVLAVGLGLVALGVVLWSIMSRRRQALPLAATEEIVVTAPPSPAEVSIPGE